MTPIAAENKSAAEAAMDFAFSSFQDFKIAPKAEYLFRGWE